MTEALALPDAARGGALAGVVIVELAQTPAGELAGGLLADLGATVVKIEPRGGSPMRQRGPGLDGEDSLAFQSENRGKHTVQAEMGELATEPRLARLLASFNDFSVKRDNYRAHVRSGNVNSGVIVFWMLAIRHSVIALLRIWIPKSCGRESRRL